MNKYHVKSHNYGAVRIDSAVEIEISADEAAELRSALAVVDKYRAIAAHAVKYKGDSDWVMYQYGVKNDKVIVNVSVGACG